MTFKHQFERAGHINGTESKVALDLLRVFDHLLHSQHVPPDLGQTRVGPDMRIPLQGIVGQDGRITTHQGHLFRIIIRKCLSKLDIIGRPLLRQR